MTARADISLPTIHSTNGAAVTLPDTMTAWRISEFGDPDVLQRTEVDVPRPSGDDVLVRVAYCGVCRHDLLTRAGAFPNVPRPLTLGHQVRAPWWLPGQTPRGVLGTGSCP